jgi:hypothetical protein
MKKLTMLAASFLWDDFYDDAGRILYEVCFAYHDKNDLQRGG